MNTVLITGARGHLGRAVSRWLLANSDRRLLLTVRREPGGRSPCDEHLSNWPGRYRFVQADLRDVSAFAGVDLSSVSEILHLAALTDFGIARCDAEAVNVEGTARLLRASRHAPQLRRFVYVSTLYAAGLATGPQAEVPWPGRRRFANHYEWSKWRAEQLVCESPGLPWQIVRPATVLAEDASGSVMQQNVVHNTMRMLYYGMLPVLPGDPATPVHTTTTDFAAAAIGRLLLSAAARRCYHLSEDGAVAPSLAGVLERTLEAFRLDKAFAASGVLAPRFCDRDAFERLSEGARHFGTVLADALDSVRPFAPQLYSDMRFETRRTVAALGGTRPPAGEALVAAVAARFATDRWQKPARGVEP